MNILHLTDFHFSEKANVKFDQKKISNAIVQKLKNQTIVPDFIFFTGDLVYSGSKLSDFSEAHSLLIQPILDEFNIPLANLFYCPGNHDVDRTKVSKAVIKEIDSFVDNQMLERFFKQKSVDLDSFLLSLGNYNSFVSQLFSSEDNVNIRSDLWKDTYTCHIRMYEGKKVGFFCANTSLRAIGDDDSSNLVMCIADLKEGLSFLQDCEFKFFLHHHPLSQLRDFNYYEIENIVHNNFNVSFSGHLHKDKISAEFTHTDGILKIATAASLAGKDGSTVGFSLFMLSLDDYVVYGTNYNFDQTKEFFYEANPIDAQIPISREKQEQNKFRSVLNDLYQLELSEADDLFLNGKSTKHNKRFNDYWTDPVVNDKSAEEVKKDKSAQSKNWSFEDVLTSDDNILIIGDDKCGKTSFLRKIQIEALKNFNKFQFIPYYIDYRKVVGTLNIEREYARYFRVNQNNAKRLLNDRRNVLLVDNFNVGSEESLNWLKDVLRPFNDVKVIISVKQDSLSKYSNISIHDKPLKQLFFHDLKKRQLKELAGKFYLEDDIRVEVLNRIQQIFNMLAIPFNFWSVSLFMWVFKENTKDIANDVDLVDLYVESILERDRLVKNKSNFGYEKYKQYLAYLAKFLLTKNHNRYQATVTEILQFTEEYLAQNPRNTVTADQVWGYVTSKGILKESVQGNYIFRLNGIFEYFLAYYLKLDQDFRNEIISDNNIYLSFKNELELYAGSNRSDEEFLMKIYDKTKSIFDECYNDLKLSEFDNLLKSLTLDSFDKIIKNSEVKELVGDLSQEDLQDLENHSNEVAAAIIAERSEVKVKEINPVNKSDILSLETAIYILGRVFKNADDIKNSTLINEIFDYLIETTIKWGFKLFDTISHSQVDFETQSKAEMFLRLMQQMLPIIVQSRISDMMGANNIEGIVTNKINRLDNKEGKHQFVLFVLLYMMADIDLAKHVHFLEKGNSLITLPILQYAILMKLMYYYHLKSVDLEPNKRIKIDEKLKAIYTHTGRSFNEKEYTESLISKVFQRLDSERIKDKQRLS
ncbi:metallophosphoesterase [Olivibacter jilunii]|uniref:metallophosphoesterase n=1 Tax=Olivibacter jilunii TaxID=985016 RepID=UPI003F16C0C7